MMLRRYATMNNLDYHEKQIKYNMTGLIAQIKKAYPEDVEIDLNNEKYKDFLSKSAFNPLTTGGLAKTLGLEDKVISLELWKDLSNGWCPVDEKSPLHKLAIDTPRGKMIKFNKTAQQILPNGQYVVPMKDEVKTRRCGTEFLFCFGERLSTVLALRAEQDPETYLTFRNLCMDTFNQEIMPEMLKEARVRLGENGVDYQSAAEILAVPFFHSENRAEQPFMHFHFDLLNVARGFDGKLYSLCTDEIGANASKYDAIFMSSMKEKIEKTFGLVLEEVKHSEDLENDFIAWEDKKTVSFDVPEELIPEKIRDYRSAREKEIEEKLKEMGKSGQSAKEIARKESRDEKTDLSPAELQAKWNKVFEENNWNYATFQKRQEAYKKQAVVKNKVVPSDEAIEESFLRNHKEVAFTENQYKAHIVKQLISHMSRENAHKRAAEIFEKSCVMALTKENFAQNADYLNDNIADPVLRHTSQLKFNRDVQFLHRSTIAKDKYISESLMARKCETGFQFDENKVQLFVRDFEAKLGKKDKPFVFTDGQRGAIKNILTQPGALSIVSGRAGAGKSTMLKAVKEYYNSQGYKVYGTSTQNSATKVLKKDTDMGRGEAYNNAKLIKLMDEGKLKLDSKTVLFWDEAGMADTASYYKIIQKVNEAGAKVVLVGESAQIQAVSAGSSFRFLTEQFEHNTARIHEINRQMRHWNREMVEDFARGESRKGVKTLHEKGKVDVTQYENQRVNKIVEDYLTTEKVACSGDIAVKYVTKTGVEKTINVNELRVKAMQKGDVDLRTDRLAVDKVLRHEELLDALKSKDPHDVEFVKKAILEKTGDELKTVVAITDNMTRQSRDLSFDEKLVVCPVNDKRNEINLAIREKLKEVPEGVQGDPKYAHVAGMLKGEDVVVKVKTKNGIEEKPMAVGEKIMITANIWSNDQDKVQLNNNQRGEIVDFIKNRQGEHCAMRVKMEEGEFATLSLNGKLEVDYSYATTTHKSQGQTKEHVFYYVDDSMINLHQAYVACSRNRDEFKMYLTEEMVTKAEANLDGKVPTAGMIKCATDISTNKAIELEDGTLDSFIKTRAWLNENYKAIDNVSKEDILLDRFIDVVDAMGQTEFKKTSFDYEIMDGKHQATYLATALNEQERQKNWVESGLSQVVVEPPPEIVVAKVSSENLAKVNELIEAERGIKAKVSAIEKEVDETLAKEIKVVEISKKEPEILVTTDEKLVVKEIKVSPKDKSQETISEPKPVAETIKEVKPEVVVEVKEQPAKKTAPKVDMAIEAEKQRNRELSDAIRKIEETNKAKAEEHAKNQAEAEAQKIIRKKK